MALYAKDVTQSIEPAQADVGILGKGIQAQAEGARLSANATGTMLKAAGFLAEQYVAYDVSKTQAEAEQVTSEFYKKGVAEETLPIIQAQRDKLAATGTSYSIVPDAETRRQAAIGAYDLEIKKLKEAVAGGMTNEEYITRVSALTRKAIAKYPGLADSIREKVATITGLPYADRYKEMEYAKARFAKQAQKDSEYDPMKFVVKDIDEIASTGKYSRKDLFDMFNNNRPEYDAISKQHNEIKGIKQNLTIVEDTLKTLTAQSDADANLTRGGFAAMFNGYLGMNVTSAYTTTLEANFKDVLARMNKGDDIKINPDALSTQIQFHNAEMRSAIGNSRDATLIAVNNYLATNPNISEEKRKQLKADIISAADLQMSKYADEKGVGLAAMSVIMVNYRDKTLKEKRDLIDLVIRQVDSMKNTPLVMAYYGMGASRENLKLTNKPFYDHMVRLEKLQSDATNGIIDQIEVFKALRETGDIIDKAYNDPAAVVTPTNAEPANVKAAHAAMQSNAQTALDKAVKGSTLSKTDINSISSALSTNVEAGPNSQILADAYKKIGDKIRLLPAESQAIIKENVSKASITNVNTMSALKRGMETKHGVKLNLGVTPTGQIVAMPTPLSKEEQARQKALGITKIPMDDPRRKEPAAIDDFNKQSRAMLSNLVFGTAMLVPEKTPLTIANEFADMLNKGQPYDGFYSNAAVAPFMGGMPGFDEAGNPIPAPQPAVVAPAAAPVESTSVVPASELGSQQFPLAPAPALPVSAAPAVAPPVVIPPAPAPAVTPPVISNAPPPASPREASGKLIDESKRPDGTFKGTGYLGVLKASDGTDVTEYSISTSDLKVKGKEIDFPLIVPTLTKAEVNLMLTDIIPNKKRIPDAIYKKAIDHAKKRIKQGKSVFAETGDYKPEAVIAPKKSSLSGRRPDLQPDAGSATSNAAPRTSTTEKWWRK